MPASPPQLVVLDTETTGLDPDDDRVIDIGAVRLGPGLEIVDRFQSLVDPGVHIPLYVTRLVGIGDDDVRGAPPFSEAYARLTEFVGEAVIAGHNVGFDRDHLAAGARRAGAPPLRATWFDTLEAALLLYPELDRHALGIMSTALGLECQTHRALPDAEQATELLRRLCARAAGLGPQERALLTAVAWEPLRLLDRYRVPPDEAPPPMVADEPSAPITAVPVPSGGWRAELGAGDAGAESEAAGTEAGRRAGGSLGAEAAEDAADGGSGGAEAAQDGGADGGSGGAEAAQDGGADGAADGAPAGMAARLPGFRRRPGQLQLAAAVDEILAGGGVGLFEAGTGMGKSLAYLLPAAFFSASRGRRVVVSTKTKALQRQLAAHELPNVAEAVGPGWRWALLMGRENYVCRRRLDEAVTGEEGVLPDRDRALALAYLVGRARRGEVDLSALPYRASRELAALAEVARDLRSSRATCMGRHCPARRACHWRAARARAESSHLVCVNHALLLTGPDTLPAFEDVVIDEAHLLYQEATEAFSEEVDALSLDLLLADLRGRRRQGSLAQRLRAAGRRLEPDQARAVDAAADACERAAGTLPDLVLTVADTLALLGRAASGSHESDPEARPAAGEPPAGRAYNTTVWVTPGLRELPAWDPFCAATSLLAECLDALSAGVAVAADALPDDHREHAAVVALADDAARLAALLSDLPESGGADHVVWGEIEAPGDDDRVRTARWRLARTPLTPAHHVREALWDRLRGAVLTSATLTVRGSFAYYREMTGLDADVDVEERVFPSPFDFSRQAVLVLEHDPGGDWRPDALADRQAERLKRLAAITGGRTLALFTNKRDMTRVAATVGRHVEDDGVLVLAQGLHGSAAALAEEFRTHPSTILLGVDTLWTGQDFPGDALTCLVIAKLPFPRQDPLFLARKRACEEAGVRWFDAFYLPETVLKFRQGFGRLIRTETDHGVVVVLDHRLSRKNYRRDFVESLPELRVIEASPAELPAVVEHYLRLLGVDGPEGSDRVPI